MTFRKSLLVAALSIAGLTLLGCAQTPPPAPAQPQAPAAAPAPKLAADILRNLLRDSRSMLVLVKGRMSRRNSHAHSTPDTPHGI